MPPHYLTKFGIKTYYQNGPKLNGIYLKNISHKIKNRHM